MSKSKDFLNSYKEMMIFAYEKVNRSRSSKRVEIIHKKIKQDLESSLSNNKLVVELEGNIEGEYMIKKVDIVVSKVEQLKGKTVKKVVAGIAVKVPLSSYNKNKYNYFENMLGETANIRSKNIPYFQILILPNKVPNWKGGVLDKHSTFNTPKSLEIYTKLSNDKNTNSNHKPNKTLILIIDQKLDKVVASTKTKYYSDVWNVLKQDDHVLEVDNTLKSKLNLSTDVFFNEYEKFIEDFSKSIISKNKRVSLTEKKRKNSISK